MDKKEKTIKKALWLLIGIPIVMVLVMFGILIYNNYLHEKELTKLRDKININSIINKDNKELDGNEELAGYTEIDIKQNNLFPLYKKYEKQSFNFNLPNDLSLQGEFIIQNNNLYFNINNKNHLINITNPEKVVIGEYGMDNTYTLKVLTKTGDIYSIDLDPNYDENAAGLTAEKVIDEFVINANRNVRYDGISNVDNISVVMRSYGNEDSAWSDAIFTYEMDGKTMAINYSTMNIEVNIDDLKFDLGPVYIKKDNTVYGNDNKKLNIKLQYLLEYIPETDFGAFIDEDNYLYVSSADSMKQGKVKGVYQKSSETLIVFEDGSSKTLNEYINYYEEN